MVVEKLRQLDRQADQSSKTIKMGDKQLRQQYGDTKAEEEPYLESIHLKMKLLSKLM